MAAAWSGERGLLRAAPRKLSRDMEMGTNVRKVKEYGRGVRSGARAWSAGLPLCAATAATAAACCALRLVSLFAGKVVRIALRFVERRNRLLGRARAVPMLRACLLRASAVPDAVRHSLSRESIRKAIRRAASNCHQISEGLGCAVQGRTGQGRRAGTPFSGSVAWRAGAANRFFAALSRASRRAFLFA